MAKVVLALIERLDTSDKVGEYRLEVRVPTGSILGNGGICRLHETPDAALGQSAHGALSAGRRDSHCGPDEAVLARK
jgi:hypothetical protein